MKRTESYNSICKQTTKKNGLKESFSINNHNLQKDIYTCIDHLDDIYSQEAFKTLCIQKSFTAWEMSGIFSRTSDFFTKRLEFQVYKNDHVFLDKLNLLVHWKEVNNAIQSIITQTKPIISDILNTDQRLYYRFRIWKYLLWKEWEIKVKSHIDTSLCNVFYYDSDRALNIHNTDSDLYKKIDYQKESLTIFWADIKKYNPKLLPTNHSVQSMQKDRIVINLSVLDKKWYYEYLEQAHDLYTNK